MVTDAIVTALRTRLETELAAPAARYRPLVVDGTALGWIDDARAALLTEFGDVFAVDERKVGFAATIADADARSAAIDRVARALAANGLLSRWRDERYAVAATYGARPYFEVERAAARFFGIHTHAAHINGLVGCQDGTRMWLARRSVGKAIDPGLLDNLVGGGIAAGASVQSTVVKEAGEEAGISAALAGLARPAGTVHICRARADGLQRETIFVHDLAVPAEFVPAAVDGEVSAFQLETLADVAQFAACRQGPEVIAADASLVIVDCLIRHGAIPAQAPDHARLSALRYPALEPSRTAR